MTKHDARSVRLAIVRAQRLVDVCVEGELCAAREATKDFWTELRSVVEKQLKTKRAVVDLLDPDGADKL